MKTSKSHHVVVELTTTDVTYFSVSDLPGNGRAVPFGSARLRMTNGTNAIAFAPFVADSQKSKVSAWLASGGPAYVGTRVGVRVIEDACGPGLHLALQASTAPAYCTIEFVLEGPDGAALANANAYDAMTDGVISP